MMKPLGLCEKEARCPVFAGGALRELRIPLAGPVAYGDRTTSGITLRRPSTTETEAFLHHARAGTGTALVPIFFGDDGAPLPLALLNTLDPDAAEAVHELALRFVPGRIRRWLPT